MRMNQPIPNEWENVDESTVALVITKRDGSKHRFLVDAEYYEICKEYHWCIRSGYAASGQSPNNLFLHRLILKSAGCDIPPKYQVDHIDGDITNNLKTNLRICTQQNNCRNTKQRINSPKIIGVRKDLRCKNSWRVQIYTDKGEKLEKTYRDETLAVLQRLVWELTYFGEFSPQMNLIKQEYPYLLNYLKVQDSMDFNSDIEIIKSIGDCLLSDKHCPCSIVKNENTICPCLPCRTKQHCHCSLFLPKYKD